MKPALRSTNLAKSIHNRLVTDVGVISVLGDPVRAYDSAPEDPVYPYLTYGDMKSEGQGGDGVDAVLHMISLHVWSRYDGRAELFDCLTVVASALESSPLSIEGGSRAVLTIPYMDVMRASDGRTLHGVLRLHAYTSSGGV